MAASSRLRSANRLLSPWPYTVSSSTASLISSLVSVFAALASRSVAALKRSCIGTSDGRVLRDGGFAQQAGDEMGLRGDFERVAQAGDLHRDQVLHQLAHPLHGVFALHHDVEVEVVDQADQQIVEFLMRAENVGETRHLVLARHAP